MFRVSLDSLNEDEATPNDSIGKSTGESDDSMVGKEEEKDTNPLKNGQWRNSHLEDCNVSTSAGLCVRP